MSTEHVKRELGRDTAPDKPAETPRHAAPDDAGVHPLIDLSRDPNPGIADHAKPED